ncbi:uncharacterized protein LOC108034453 [Drosophila biarmipes]|uniref:uncharacterized protein LOC108034453 n=1 Tax=Drosophila biarmipes TaxID=125945 RepID=UPI0007E8901F|nr:uncharacterized protein LOC108034453 [Drosophila biarmipes]
MKLIVLFVLLSVFVGVLSSVPDEVDDGLTTVNGEMSATSYNRTLTRDKRALHSIFGILIAVGISSIADERRMLDNMDFQEVRNPQLRIKGLVDRFYEEFNDKNKFCTRRLNRRKRQPNPSLPNCILPILAIGLSRGFYNRVEELAEELRGRSDTMTTDVSNGRQPVLDYTTITAPPNQDHAQPIDLTVTMRASLTYNNTAHTPRAPIDGAITSRMQEMDWYRGGNQNTNDERGHLLADSLGGPSVPWNFVPQSPSVNRGVSITGGVTYCWFDLEEEIRTLLRDNQDHYIIWTILVSYGGLPASRRPTGFMISIRLMTSDHQFRNYRIFMIPNVPSNACNNPSHPYWHPQ